MIDLLAHIRVGEISFDEAADLLLKANEEFHQRNVEQPWNHELGFSDFEASAYLQGATIEDLYELRYEGWPSKCCNCKQPLDYKSYGWMIRHINNAIYLEHLKCPLSP